jgi:hypothetical protein
MYTVCKGGGGHRTGGDLRQIKPASKSLYRSVFLGNAICNRFYQSNLSTGTYFEFSLYRMKFFTDAVLFL